MKLLFTLARRYPGRTIATLSGILFAGISEGFGVSALLPLLNTVFSRKIEAAGGSPSELSSYLDRLLDGILGAVGLQSTIGVLLGLFIGCIVLKCVLLFLANRQIGYTVARIATEMRLALLRALFASRWEYFIRQPIGQLTNGIAFEAHRAATAFQFGARLIATAIESGIYIVLAVLVSWEATLLALGGGLFILFVLRRLIKKLRRAGERQTTHTQDLVAQMTDVLISIKPLKAMAREDSAGSVLEDRTRRLNRALQKQVLNKAALTSFQEPLMMLFLVLCLYAALSFWNLPLPSIMAMVFFIGKILKQVQKIQNEYGNLAEYEAAYWSLAGKIETASKDAEPEAGSRIPELNEAVRFEEVAFGYDEKRVLEKLSLRIPARKMTVLCGPSGSGKTTIADLLIGLLRPQAGRIWIDTLPLEEVDLRAWRRRIGYVTQENILLSDTVFQNVTLGQKDLTEEEVEVALKNAGAWDFVSAMPRGMHTPVGERGAALSGGQRQRIAIARALVKKPALLILDEATTALDPQTEREICATLKSLSAKITIFAISHQSTLLDCADLAYRMEGKGVRPIKSPADILSSLQPAAVRP